MSEEKEGTTPSWLKDKQPSTPTKTAGDEENQDETTPLFGTGTVSLQDSPGAENPSLAYGTAPKKNGTVEGDDDDDDEEEETHDPTWHESPEKKKKDKKSSKKKKEDTRRPPRKNCCLHFFTVFEMIAIIACLGLLLTQITPLFFVSIHDIGFLQLALRFYVSLFCLIFIMVEMELPVGFVHNSVVLQNYFSRGFLYSFVGLIGMEEAYEVIVSNLLHPKQGGVLDEFHIEWLPLLIKGASWLMVVTGCCYMIFGVFFLKHLRDGLRRNYNHAMDEYEREVEREGIV